MYGTSAGPIFSPANAASISSGTALARPILRSATRGSILKRHAPIEPFSLRTNDLPPSIPPTSAGLLFSPATAPPAPIRSSAGESHPSVGHTGLGLQRPTADRLLLPVNQVTVDSHHDDVHGAHFLASHRAIPNTLARPSKGTSVDHCGPDPHCTCVDRSHLPADQTNSATNSPRVHGAHLLASHFSTDIH